MHQETEGFEIKYSIKSEQFESKVISDTQVANDDLMPTEWRTRKKSLENDPILIKKSQGPTLKRIQKETSE